MLSVFVREQCLFSWNTPVNTQAIIKDTETTISFGMIKLITFILEYRCLTQHSKAVCKATGHKELTMIIFCQFYCYMLSISGATFADINSHIKDCSFDTTH